MTICAVCGNYIATGDVQSCKVTLERRIDRIAWTLIPLSWNPGYSLVNLSVTDTGRVEIVLRWQSPTQGVKVVFQEGERRLRQMVPIQVTPAPKCIEQE